MRFLIPLSAYHVGYREGLVCSIGLLDTLNTTTSILLSADLEQTPIIHALTIEAVCNSLVRLFPCRLGSICILSLSGSMRGGWGKH